MQQVPRPAGRKACQWCPTPQELHFLGNILCFSLCLAVVFRLVILRKTCAWINLKLMEKSCRKTLPKPRSCSSVAADVPHAPSLSHRHPFQGLTKGEHLSGTCPEWLMRKRRKKKRKISHKPPYIFPGTSGSFFQLDGFSRPTVLPLCLVEKEMGTKSHQKSKSWPLLR